MDSKKRRTEDYLGLNNLGLTTELVIESREEENELIEHDENYSPILSVLLKNVKETGSHGGARRGS